MVTIISIDEAIPEEALLEMVEQIIITKEEIPHGCNLIVAKISCKHARFTDFEGSVFINYSSTIIEEKGMVRVTITPVGYFETKQHFTSNFNAKKWVEKIEFDGNDEEYIRGLQLTMEEELVKSVKELIAYCLISLLDAEIILSREGNKTCYNLIVKPKVAFLLRGFFEKDKMFNEFLRNIFISNLKTPDGNNSAIENQYSKEKVIIRLSAMEPIKWQIDKYE
jgi:hypothetical protein